MKVDQVGPNVMTARFSDGATFLFSYETAVAAYIPLRGYIKASKKWSSTTAKHINAWIGAHTAEPIPQTELDALVGRY